MKITTWNTGRGYTERGQIINAARVNGVIAFVDTCRQVEGIIEDVDPDDDIRCAVMAAYDACTYRHIPTHESEQWYEAAMELRRIA